MKKVWFMEKKNNLQLVTCTPVTCKRVSWKWYSFSIFNFAFSIVLSGCVKDTLHRTSHPSTGAVRVETDWSGRSAEAREPSRLVVLADETSARSTAWSTARSFVLDAGGGSLEGLFSPGTLSLLVYNEPSGMTVRDGIARVDVLADGTLEPCPGYLFTGTTAAEVAADDTTGTRVIPRQLTRRLTLSLGTSEEDLARVSSFPALLTGLAGSVDLDGGKLTAGQETGATRPVFSVVTGDDGRLRLEATLYLVGVIPGGKQVLTLTLGLTDGSTCVVETDMTTILRDFGNGANPLSLTATLQLPPPAEVEPGVSATITGWTVIDNGNVEIH